VRAYNTITPKPTGAKKTCRKKGLERGERGTCFADAAEMKLGEGRKPKTPEEKMLIPRQGSSENKTEQKNEGKRHNHDPGKRAEKTTRTTRERKRGRVELAIAPKPAGSSEAGELHGKRKKRFELRAAAGDWTGARRR